MSRCLIAQESPGFEEILRHEQVIHGSGTGTTEKCPLVIEDVSEFEMETFLAFLYTL